MAYSTYADLVLITGSTESTSTTLPAIILSADHEIDAYLGAAGVTGTAGNTTLKEASLKLSQAGLLELRVQKGTYIASSGEMVNGVDAQAATDITNAARELRKQAFDLLNQYIAAQSTATKGGIHVSRVRSRCC
jgi:hypothetical protein